LLTEGERQAGRQAAMARKVGANQDGVLCSKVFAVSLVRGFRGGAKTPEELPKKAGMIDSQNDFASTFRANCGGTPTMTLCFQPSCAASSTSAGYRTHRFAGFCLT
jgi:hypothetical protein